MLLQQSDRDRFDTFIASCDYGNFLQTWGWGELKATTGWTPHRIAIERDSQIHAAAQILERSIPGVHQSLFYCPRGPIVDLAHQELFDALMAEIHEFAKTRRAMALKIDPAIRLENDTYITMIKKHGFSPVPVREDAFGGTQPKYVMALSIADDEEALLARFKSKWRYNIRLATRKGVTVQIDCPRDDIAKFYDVLVETAARDGFKVRSRAYFYDMYDLLISSGSGGLFLTRFGDEVIGGAIALTCGNTAWYVYGASSDRHRNKMPNHLMQWEMMKWSKARGCKVYDMRGVAKIDNTKTPLQGLNRFKEGFDAQYIEYIGEWDLIYSPTWYHLFTVAEPMVRKLRLMLAGLRK